MRGTPYIYNGDEIGMINSGFDDISKFKDIQTVNEFEYQKSNNADLDAYLKKIIKSSRDNSRTPFQWSSDKNAGFTTGNPWIMVGTSYKEINYQSQEKDPNSTLNYFRKVVQLRKNNNALVYGNYTLLDAENPDIYAYTRIHNKNKLLVVLNFSDNTASTELPKAIKIDKIEINNMSNTPEVINNIIKLKPWQAVIYRLN